MMWYTHAIFGLFLYGILGLLGAPLNEETLAMAVLGALMPDIDHPKSYISTKLPFGNAVPKFVEHRGATHTVEAALLITAVVGGIAYYLTDNPWTVVAFFLGYISHLLADSLTVSGVKWSRFSKFHPRGPVKTGTWREGVVLVVVTFLTVAMLLYARGEATGEELLGLALVVTLALVGKRLKRLR